VLIILKEECHVKAAILLFPYVLFLSLLLESGICPINIALGCSSEPEAQGYTVRQGCCVDDGGDDDGSNCGGKVVDGTKDAGGVYNGHGGLAVFHGGRRRRRERGERNQLLSYTCCSEHDMIDWPFPLLTPGTQPFPSLTTTTPSSSSSLSLLCYGF